MKVYKIMQSEGNINGWHSPKEVGRTVIPEHHAETLNAQKSNTGTEYIEVAPDEKPAEVGHGEANVDISSGKMKKVGKAAKHTGE